MAESVTLNSGPIVDGAPRRHVIDWVSDADGTADGTVGPVYGVLLRAVFNPGSPAPTDNYDVTLTDDDGVDVLSGLGANRHTTTTQEVIPLINGSDGTNTTPLPRALANSLTMAITNAGDSKAGKIVLYLR
jgi:hypothetical protein